MHCWLGVYVQYSLRLMQFGLFCVWFVVSLFSIHSLLPFRANLTHWGRDKWTPFRRRHIQMHFREWKYMNFDWNLLRFVSEGLINNIPALVLIMAWRRPGEKPLSEPMVVSLPTHICVARPQWVNVTGWIVRFQWIALIDTSDESTRTDSITIRKQNKNGTHIVNQWEKFQSLTQAWVSQYFETCYDNFRKELLFK